MEEINPPGPFPCLRRRNAHMVQIVGPLSRDVTLQRSHGASRDGRRPDGITARHMGVTSLMLTCVTMETSWDNSAIGF